MNHPVGECEIAIGDGKRLKELGGVVLKLSNGHFVETGRASSQHTNRVSNRGYQDKTRWRINFPVSSAGIYTGALTAITPVVSHPHPPKAPFSRPSDRQVGLVASNLEFAHHHRSEIDARRSTLGDGWLSTDSGTGPRNSLRMSAAIPTAVGRVDPAFVTAFARNILVTVVAVVRENTEKALPVLMSN